MKEVCIDEAVKFCSDITINGEEFRFSRLYEHSRNDIDLMKKQAVNDGVEYYTIQKVNNRTMLFGASPKVEKKV